MTASIQRGSKDSASLMLKNKSLLGLANNKIMVGFRTFPPTLVWEHLVWEHCLGK